MPPLGEAGEVVADYAATGLSLRRHPLSFVRDALGDLGAAPLASLQQRAHGEQACVAGLVLCRQRPATASGVVFVTLEDETGVGNLLVRSRIAERCWGDLATARCLLARGRVEREGQVIHLLPTHLEDVSSLVGDLETTRYDFR